MEGKLNWVPSIDDSHGEDRTAFSLFFLACSEQHLALNSLKLVMWFPDDAFYTIVLII